MWYPTQHIWGLACRSKLPWSETVRRSDSGNKTPMLNSKLRGGKGSLVGRSHFFEEILRKINKIRKASKQEASERILSFSVSVDRRSGHPKFIRTRYAFRLKTLKRKIARRRNQTWDGKGLEGEREKAFRCGVRCIGAGGAGVRKGESRACPQEWCLKSARILVLKRTQERNRWPKKWSSDRDGGFLQRGGFKRGFCVC
jgi:hypothetical protein